MQTYFPDLRRAPSISRSRRRAWRGVLSLGPWLWPSNPQTRDALCRSLEINFQPTPPHGVALAVSCHQEQTQGTLTVLGCPPGGPDKSRDVLPFGPSAQETRRNAQVALSGALPLLWTSVRDAVSQVPNNAVFLNAVRHFDGRCIQQPEVIDGGSLGLAMGLALVSRVLRCPIPPHIVASATLDSMGRIGPVEGIGIKVQTLRHGAPGIFADAHPVLLVHKDNEQEARCHAGSNLEVRPIASFSQAIQTVWGDALAERLLADIRTPDQRDELIASLFSMALGDRSGTRVWTPILNTARRALEWEVLDEPQRWKLGFVQAIASRHQGLEHDTLSWPQDDWINTIPQPSRLQLVAHLIQHATASAQLDHKRALALGARYLLRDMDAFEGHLRVMGAMGRLLAVIGRPQEAFKLQLEAAQGWMIRRLHFDLSYPVCELYRLAAAMTDGELSDHQLNRATMLEEAETHYLKAATLTSEHISPYLIMARCQARLLVNHWPDQGLTLDEAVETLTRLWERRGERLHLSWSTGRVLARYHRSQNNLMSLSKIKAIFEDSQQLPPDEESNREIYHHLLRLDASLDTTDSGESAGVVLKSFRQTRPALTDRLFDTATRLGLVGDQRARYVRRLYPY